MSPRRGDDMRLIDRLLAAVSERVCRNRPVLLVEVDDQGISATSRGQRLVYGWSEIERVVAMRTEQLAANAIMLVFGFTGGRTLLVDETNGCWSALVSAIARQLPRAAPAATWQLQLIAEPASRVEVYHRR